METIKINIGGIITEMDKELVSGALEAGELKVENENLVIYDKESFETFKKNLSNSEYFNGKTAGEEMFVKNAREKMGLEFEGKSFDNFTEAFKSKILEEAKVEPSKKIQELTGDLEKIRKNYSTLEDEYTGFKTQIQQKEEGARKDSELLKSIPVNGLVVNPDIALIALKNKSGIDISFDESGLVIPMKNGQPVKDEKTLQPVDLGSLIATELNSLGLIKRATGGSGGDDETGGRGQKSSYEKFEEEMTKKEINPGSLAFSQEMEKRIKEKTLSI